jgi:LmbE family N-acetylglucosaminyl deacetylase
MKLLTKMAFVLTTVLCSSAGTPAQTAQVVKGADERYKTDILIVVAHPDDEGFFTPYAAKAIYDMHKRVAVIFTTHGGGGVNHYSRERGPAMAEEREIEARQACAKLSITNVWFLDGKDTRSQDVLDSLSTWGHGANLERLIGLIRLTRPEVIFTHFPGILIGEDHGDHQATGVLVTEAFDLAGNPTVFPSQLGGPTDPHEPYLSNLQPWQAKKIYLGSDANDEKQFKGTGPTYSVWEVSPSQKKPYWRLAIESAITHETQFPEMIDRISKMSDEELQRMMNDPNDGWWSEPSTLIFGKSVVDGKATDDVFTHIEEKPSRTYSEATVSCGDRRDGTEETVTRLELGGPWAFYQRFYPAHGLCQLPVAKVPELGIKTGTTLLVPLVIHHDPTKSVTLSLQVKAPEGWKVVHGEGPFMLPAEETTSLAVHIQTPTLSADGLKKAVPEEVRVSAEAEGKSAGEVHLRVLLRASALPEEVNREL